MPEPYTITAIRDGLKLCVEQLQEHSGNPHSPVLAPSNGHKLGKNHRHPFLTSRVIPNLRNAGLGGESLFRAAWEITEQLCEITPDFGKDEVRKICKHFDGKESLSLTAAKEINGRVIVPTIISLPELLSREHPPIRWIVQDILPEGLTVLAGAPTLGKSWMALHLATCVAKGALALGKFECGTGSALVIPLEDTPARLKKRFAKILGEEPIPDAVFFPQDCRWPRMGKDSNGLDAIQRWLENNRETARLVVIDPFVKFRPSDSGSKKQLYERDYEDAGLIQELAGMYGVAILVISHTNQGEHRDPLHRVSGSTGIIGAADTVWLFEKADRMELDATIFVSGRDVEERKGALTFNRDRGLWTWIGEAADIAKSKERREILEILRDEKRSLRPHDIAKLLTPEKDPGTVSKTLTRMLADGEVIREGYGKYKLHEGDTHKQPGASSH